MTDLPPSTPTSPALQDPVAARAALAYLGEMQTLKLAEVEIRRKESEIKRHEATIVLLRGKWAGPMVLSVLAIVAIVIVGIFAASGADLTIAVSLADRVVTIIRGCPTP